MEKCGLAFQEELAYPSTTVVCTQAIVRRRSTPRTTNCRVS